MCGAYVSSLTVVSHQQRLCHECYETDKWVDAPPPDDCACRECVEKWEGPS